MSPSAEWVHDYQPIKRDYKVTDKIMSIVSVVTGPVNLGSLRTLIAIEIGVAIARAIENELVA